MIADSSPASPFSDDLDGRPLLHTRGYDVAVFGDDAGIVVVGSVRDDKPAGLYIAEDPEPLTIHHMHVALHVEVPSMTIHRVDVRFSRHPHASCPSITTTYDQLVGLSIARGFNRRIRELFGGPRGCTHTSALLQAMGPVAVQSMWSLQIAAMRKQGLDPFDPAIRSAKAADADFEARVAGNLNTCHIWDEDGEQVAAIRRGEVGEPPLWITERRVELRARQPQGRADGDS